MTRPRGRSVGGVSAAVVAGAACVLAPEAGAFSWFTFGSFDVVWPGATSDRWLANGSFPDGSPIEELAIAAMTLWNIVPGSTFEYRFGKADITEINNQDGFNDTGFVPNSSLDPGVLGVTYLVNQGPAWFDMDVVFAASPGGLPWLEATNPTCVEVDDPDTFGFSFLLVATHEFGHAIGLGHEPVEGTSPTAPWFIATMNPGYPAGGPVGDLAIVELHADDRNGARFLYPSSGPSGPARPDLANSSYTAGATLGRAVPVFTTPGSAAPGETFTARAGIQNFGDVNHLRVSQGFYLSRDEAIDPSTDVALGFLEWDLAVGDLFDFDADITLPDDIEAGAWWLGSVVDDVDEVAEEFEDNNTHVYCAPFVVEQLAPVIEPIVQQFAEEGTPYVGPTPAPTKPLNMAPIAWSLIGAPAGLGIDPATGVLRWEEPVAAEFLYVFTVRATNGAGNADLTVFLGVSPYPCPGDGNRDGVTDLDDFSLLAIQFGRSVPAGTLGDLDGDGVVGLDDFSVLAVDFGCVVD